MGAFSLIVVINLLNRWRMSSVDVQKLSDDQLRKELIKINASHIGPITSSTRSLYEKKLTQLRNNSMPKNYPGNAPATEAKQQTSPLPKTEDELRTALTQFGVKVGPITDTTRQMYQNKLTSLRSSTQGSSQKMPATQLQLNKQKSPKMSSAAQTLDDNDSSEEEFQQNPSMDWEQAPIPLNVRGGGRNFPIRDPLPSDDCHLPQAVMFAHQSAHVVSDLRRWSVHLSTKLSMCYVPY